MWIVRELISDAYNGNYPKKYTILIAVWNHRYPEWYLLRYYSRYRVGQSQTMWDVNLGVKR